jgi:putative oxidoreductase
MATSVVPARPRQIDLALLILRVIVGIVFIAHGSQKLFVFGVAGTQGAFAQMGAPAPAVTAVLIMAIEILGGLALIIGLLARLAAIGLVIDMLGAMLIVHLKNGFFLPTGVEFALTLMTVALAIAIAGPGAYSADGAIARRR